MFSHIFSGAFISNAFWILVFCMLLVPVLYGTYRGAIAIITGLAAGDENVDPHKAGCLGFVVLIVFIYLILYLCQGLANKFVTMPEPPSKTNQNNLELNREYGPVLIFRKEAPLLYNYYQELGSYRKKQESHVARLKEEFGQTTSEGAQKELESMQLAANEKLQQILNMRKRIEDIAGRVYFARYMAALGVGVNDKALQEEVKSLTDEGANILTQQKEK